STRVLVDGRGAPVATYRYDAYGTTTAHTGTASTPLQYAGQYTDAESGLYYLRARYYDPATGQFLSRDPLVSLTQAPYGYAGENPVNLTDPSGLFFGLENLGSWFNQHASGISTVASVVSDVSSLIATGCTVAAFFTGGGSLVCSAIFGGISEGAL